MGPPKTGTTSTQTSLTVWKDELRKDRYDYLGFHMWPNPVRWKNYGPVGAVFGNPAANCLNLAMKSKTSSASGGGGDETPDCWKTFMTKHLKEYYHNNTSSSSSSDEEGRQQRAVVSNSAIVSDEAWTRRRADDYWTAKKLKFLETEIREYYDLEAVVTYRRLVDWYPSARRQILLRGKRKTWPKNGIPPLFPGVLKLSRTMEHSHYPSPLKLVRALERENVTFRVLNFHELSSGGDLLQNFVCNVLRDADHTCAMARMENATKIHMGSDDRVKEDLLYDELVTHAASAGVVGVINTTLVKRMDALEIARWYQENVLNKTGGPNEFPMKCPSRSELEEYLQHSIEMERLVVPDFAIQPGVEEDHAAKFWNSAETTNKFCSVDAEKVLKDPNWKTLWERCVLTKMTRRKTVMRCDE